MIVKLCAGEMFVPAGYSPGRSVCARGGRSAWREQFLVAALGVRFTPAMCFCWGLAFDHACNAFLSERFAFDLRGEGYSGVTETCPAPIYGWASRVVLRGSKRKPHCGHSGTRKDLPESNLCSGGSCCITMLPTRTIEDLPNSNLWFGKSCYIARQQVEAALRPEINICGGVDGHGRFAYTKNA